MSTPLQDTRTVLAVEGLRIECGERALVADATLSVASGEIVALVGSSGSGKSMTARALLGMVPVRPGVTAGRIRVCVDGRATIPNDEAAFRALRGNVVGMLWQDARGALNPLRTIGAQVLAASRLAGLPRDPAEALARAGFPEPYRIVPLYPHVLSGGMAQRAAIAVALARGSRFLLADEPTNGLDPAVQRTILGQLAALAHAGTGILFITHDLRLLPDFAHRIVVMEGGRTVSTAATVGALTGAGLALADATRKIAGGVL